jgi:predicted ATPase/DNA-binding NarL/FixJ family response regulator/Tfp pilus assembly protein PilF
MSATSGLARHQAPLPIALTPLLGRIHELGQVRDLVLDPANRLITLTGPGGVGKTRLALQIASSLLDELEGEVVFVPLAAITDPNLVLPAIGQAFGMFGDSQGGYEDRLAELLGHHQTFLVLDNFEQVLDAAEAVANILSRCRRLTVLVTSQAALGIPGEQLYPIAPLPTPAIGVTSTASILQADAVILFLQRARAVNPHLVADDQTAMTIGEICRKLDGLPLAIELAAARTNILSPEALLARLSNRLQVLGSERRGVPDRLRTMRHAIAWSYELLPPHEQALFRRLSVFMGGFSLEALEAVFQPTGDDRLAYDVFSALVDHSLVQKVPRLAGDTRYSMLETLRDYGLEQLELTGELDAAHMAHATWFLNLAETAEPHLIGSEQEKWLDLLDTEADNLRTATDWCLSHNQGEMALRTVAAIWRYSAVRGLATERRSWIERTLVAEGVDRSPYRSKALIGAGYLAEDQRELEAAQVHFEEAALLAAEMGNKLDECMALIGLGTVAHDQGDYETALGFHQRAVMIAREVDDSRSIAVALGNLASVSYYQGNLDDAERYWDEARLILQALGDTMGESLAASNLGVLALDRGDYERADELLTRALDLQRRTKTFRDISITLINLGEAWLGLENYTLAQKYFAEAIEILRQYEFSTFEGIALNGCAKLALAQGDITEATSKLLESTRLIEPSGDLFAMANNAEVLASICSAVAEHGKAVELLAIAAAIRQEIGAAVGIMQQVMIDRIQAAARKALSKDDHARHLKAAGEFDRAGLPRRIHLVAREIMAMPTPLEASKPIIAPVAEQLPHNLTNREIEVLRLLAQGHSTREISEALFISPRTTATHVTNILGKLEVTSRTAAVALAMRSGLV